MAQMNKVHI